MSWLPAPPITPYGGPFAGEARAFVGQPDFKHPDRRVLANWVARNDYTHRAEKGVYDPALDPRPINTAFEAAVLEDWRRMGYNCAYKGTYFTFMVGAHLKHEGLLGAIDQTLFGQNGPPPIGYDGALGNRYAEACGSFFHPDNYQAGVAAITGMGHHYGQHLFTVGDHRLTCSWDEVGMRTRSWLDYREPAPAEFRKFLRDVWFQDASPDRDTNHDGRTYNGLTGQQLTDWQQVEPIKLSQKWSVPVALPNGSFQFSAQPELDAAIFRSGLYARISSTKSVPGQFAAVVRYRIGDRPTGKRDVLLLGHSKIEAAFSQKQFEQENPDSKLQIVLGSSGGTTEKM